MKLQTRFALLLVFVFLVVGGIVYIQRDFDQQRSQKLLSSDLVKNQNLLENDIKSEGQKFQSLQVDYSFWDSMVALAKNPGPNLSPANLTFAQQNIDTGIQTYNTDAAWVYNSNGQLIYTSLASPTQTLKNIPVSSAYFANISKNNFVDYFLNTSLGIVEVRAATIVPSNDQYHKDSASGYWIIARYLGSDFKTSISNLSQTKISFTEANSYHNNNTFNNTVSVYIPLKDWQGNIQSYLVSSDKINLIGQLDSLYNTELEFVAGLGLALVLLVSFAIWILVLRPLKIITDSITLEQPRNLDAMAKSKNQFGALASTVQEFFNQKAKITQATADLRSANEALKKQDSVKDDFISMISHQLGTPLAVMDGFLTLIVQGFYGKPNDKMQDALEKTLSRTRNMKGLVFDLLNISRMTAGKFFLEISDVDLSKVVAEEIEELQRQAHDRNVKLIYHPSEHTIPILKIDEPKTRQAILNLINNAIFYSPNGTVNVYLDSDDNNVIFKVMDTGIGVPEEEKPHLFTKFFRAENARKESPNGTGIGLYLVKRVVTDQHGRLIFSSQVGKGSVFGFTLPIKDNQLSNIAKNDNKSDKAETNV
jgi:signal transduction histidine kinase